MRHDGLSAREVLTTTRSVRRRLDFTRPVPIDLIRQALAMAIQAPSGGDLQGWSWVAVGNPELKRKIASRYREFFTAYREHSERAASGRGPSARGWLSDGAYLAENLHRASWLVIPCLSGPLGRADEGMGAFAQAMTWASIYPAVWSFQLALRSLGLASCLTTNHLSFEREIADLLGIPYAETNQAALLPVAYPLGEKFRPAHRRPIDDVLRIDHW